MSKLDYSNNKKKGKSAILKTGTIILIFILISSSCSPKYTASFNYIKHQQTLSKYEQKNFVYEENKSINNEVQSMSLKDDFELGSVLASTDDNISLSSKETQIHADITDKQLKIEQLVGQSSIKKNINKTTDHEVLSDNQNIKGDRKKNRMAVVGFSLIISGFLLLGVPFLGVMLLGIGAALCFKALKKERNVSNNIDNEIEGTKNVEHERKRLKGLALAGLIFLGIIIIIGIIGLIILFTQSP